MSDTMSLEEFHEYQATGRLPKRLRKPTRSEALAKVAAVSPDMARTAAKAVERTPANDNPGPALTILERDFQSLVEQAARAANWYVYHTYNSRRSEPGFPDLVLVNPTYRRTVFAELKAERGYPSEAQKQWLWALEAAGQEAYLWRPSDWDAITEVLTGGAR